MDWSAPIDAYCERLGPQFWAEPVNAATNGAFLIAALAAWMLWRRQARGDAAVLFLVGVVACVGIGSFLFHTFATRWAALADVVPIAVFIYSYFLLAMRRILQLGWGWSIGATLAFLAASYGVAPMLSGVLGSSAGYAPAALAIFGVAAVAARRCPPASAPLALTAILVAAIAAGPEILTALRAALANRMQAVVNIALGASLSTVILTVPVIEAIALFTGQPFTMAMTPVQITMTAITLVVAAININDGETNAIEGMTHFVLFATFIMLSILGL